MGATSLAEAVDGCPGHITSGPADEVLELLFDTIGKDDLHLWDIAVYFRRATAPKENKIESTTIG